MVSWGPNLVEPLVCAAAFWVKPRSKIKMMMIEKQRRISKITIPNLYKKETGKLWKTLFRKA
jgi:hypothetical protein